MYASEELNGRLPYAFGDELAWLREHAKYVNRAVMIGAGPGVMAMALLEGNPDMHLVIIDNSTCYYAQTHIKHAGLPSPFCFLSDSAEFGKDYGGEQLDLLIVDGDHTKEGVLRDINAWFKHVKPGGMIFFHDYENINDDQTNGVAEALVEAKMDAEDVDTPGISIVYRKNFYG